MVNEIDSVQLEQKIAAGDEVYLLDIRTEAEVAHGMLPNSRHIPMHMIPTEMSSFPKDKEVVLYCRSGARSYHACMFLMQQGFSNVFNLRGGIIDWARNRFDIVPFA